MIDVKVYGRPSSRYEFVLSRIKQRSAQAGIKLNLQEINSVDEFVKEGIHAIPTVKVNGTYTRSYRQGQDFHQFIKDIELRIVKEENLGNMLKIIVPTDFSETSNNAFEYAKSLAEKYDAVIQFVHFYHPTSVEFEGAILTDLATEEIRKHQLDEYVDNIKNEWVGSVSDTLIDKKFIIGFAGNEIKTLTKEKNTLVVIGSSGSGGSLKKIFGSTSITIVQNARCPVFVVPPKVSLSKMTKVAYACGDLENQSEPIETISELIKPFNPELHLVHVNNQPDGFPEYELLEYWKLHYPKNLIASHTIEYEDVIEGINAFIRKEDLDLLIMKAGKRGFLDRLFNPSITKRMAINTTIPLLIV